MNHDENSSSARWTTGHTNTSRLDMFVSEPTSASAELFGLQPRHRSSYSLRVFRNHHKPCSIRSIASYMRLDFQTLAQRQFIMLIPQCPTTSPSVLSISPPTTLRRRAVPSASPASRQPRPPSAGQCETVRRCHAAGGLVFRKLRCRVGTCAGVDQRS